MKYFLAETDKKNHIPYGINVNRAVDIRYANRSMAYDGWENAKRLAATVMVALEDSMPDSDHNGDIGTVVMIDKDVSKEEVFSIIESQNDSCGNNIDNPIGDRLSFYAVGGDYKAKEGEIIIYTDGDKDRGGHVFHYG